MSKKSEVTKNDTAWKLLFEKFQIVENVEKNGYVEITANDILETSGREPRLMAKFDHRKNLPKMFSDNDLSILPVTRGSYIISGFDAYKSIEPLHNEITQASLPEYIESINHENITSEATAINCAYVSGILADFLEDEGLKPTVSGRMSSGEFSFYIHSTSKDTSVEVNVINSQVEIDGGYEGIRQLGIIEAKNSISDDFLIRQLYYPYRLWVPKIKKKSHQYLWCIRMGYTICINMNFKMLPIIIL